MCSDLSPKPSSQSRMRDLETLRLHDHLFPDTFDSITVENKIHLSLERLRDEIETLSKSSVVCFAPLHQTKKQPDRKSKSCNVSRTVILMPYSKKDSIQIVLGD